MVGRLFDRELVVLLTMLLTFTLHLWLPWARCECQREGTPEKLGGSYGPQGQSECEGEECSACVCNTRFYDRNTCCTNSIHAYSHRSTPHFLRHSLHSPLHCLQKCTACHVRRPPSSSSWVSNFGHPSPESRPSSMHGFPDTKAHRWHWSAPTCRLVWEPCAIAVPL